MSPVQHRSLMAFKSAFRVCSVQVGDSLVWLDEHGQTVSIRYVCTEPGCNRRFQTVQARSAHARSHRGARPSVGGLPEDGGPAEGWRKMLEDGGDDEEEAEEDPLRHLLESEGGRDADPADQDFGGGVGPGPQTTPQH